jgi:hypothetical protein
MRRPETDAATTRRTMDVSLKTIGNIEHNLDRLPAAAISIAR